VSTIFPLLWRKKIFSTHPSLTVRLTCALLGNMIKQHQVFAFMK